MKFLLTLVVVALVSVGASACGDTSINASHTSVTGTVTRDRDNDNDNNDDDSRFLNYGRVASTTDQQALTRLVRNFYAAAAAEDGAKACSMFMPFIAESVPEHYRESPGLRGKTCAVVMSKVFKWRHALLANENSTLKVISARTEGTKALTLLTFAALPEVRQLRERFIHGRWKMLYISDSNIE